MTTYKIGLSLSTGVQVTDFIDTDEDINHHIGDLLRFRSEKDAWLRLGSSFIRVSQIVAVAWEAENKDDPWRKWTGAATS